MYVHKRVNKYEVANMQTFNFILIFFLFFFFVYYYNGNTFWLRNEILKLILNNEK